MRRDAERMNDRLLQTALAAALIAAALLAAPANAAPRSIADCEKIQEADAYNRCLASFGPMRGQRGATYPGVASEGGQGDRGDSDHSGAYRPQRRYGGAQASYGRGGRMRMEFTRGR
ncbi:MAG: hypothetical protein HYS63_02660 [Methylocystis sp.]|nr:hypothetical protein [Methylocystis sp.]